jgi:hypothetical protein
VDSPVEKRKQIENDDEKQKKKQEYEKNRSDRKFPSKWQTEPKETYEYIFSKYKYCESTFLRGHQFSWFG